MRCAGARDERLPRAGRSVQEQPPAGRHGVVSAQRAGHEEPGGRHAVPQKQLRRMQRKVQHLQRDAVTDAPPMQTQNTPLESSAVPNPCLPPGG